jgi:antitoxin ParD1/3/4
LGKNTSITLSDHLAGFIEAQVNEGHYASPSEVVDAALQLLQAQEAKLAALRAALIAGEESGPSTAFDIDDFLAEMHRTHASG